MRKTHNIVLFLSFIAVVIAIVYAGTLYKSDRISAYQHKQQSDIAQALSRDVATLIEEKKNATLAIALSMVQNLEVQDLMHKGKDVASVSRDFSQRLREETDFKNVWIQLIDREGRSLSRSWTDMRGDDLAAIREDVRGMIAKPEAKSTISVGRFDMSFKSMVPIYDAEAKFAGILEVITHFNSIAVKIREKGFEPVILIDGRYMPQITYPFSKKFVGDHYVANRNADPNLLEYIARRGMESFISVHAPYVVDEERALLVVNYTLFDTQQKPMANFLMFKPLEQLDLASAANIRLTVNLYMLLAILCVGFGFYLLAVKEDLFEHLPGRSKMGSFIGGFLLVSATYYLLLNWDYHQHRDEYLKAYNQNIYKDYQIIHKKFSTVARTMFESVLNKPAVLQLLAQAYGSEEKKAEARHKLKVLLDDEYELFKEQNLRQLHFHLRNNESFLRFHRPAKFGDNLTGIRSTVEWVNTHQQPISGFEEGRIYNGFRYVFPLFLQKERGEREHIGSVETSFTPYALANEFAASHDAKVGFFVKSKIVDSKVFKDEHINYSESELPGYYYEKSVKKQLEHAFEQMDERLLDKELLQNISHRIDRGEVFSLPSSDRSVLFTFLPVKNPVTNHVVAVFVLQGNDVIISSQYNHFIAMLLAGFTTILFVFLYIYREFETRRRFEELSLKMQRILDAQKSIVIITDGRQIIDCNRKFLEFLGFADLDAFKKVYDCICERFEENDRFFHLGKVPEGENWITVLEELPAQEHIVSISSVEGVPHAFTVSINHFDEDYIISFADISETMREHFSLEQRASRDKLTGAFNRDYFSSNIDLLIEEARRQETNVGFIIFDIDHFKEVNDTYGHGRGDSVLKNLVQRVKETVRQEDLLIRWGGEEFLIVVKIDHVRNLGFMAENIRKRIAREPFEDVGPVSCSFGVTLYSGSEMVEASIERADRALYMAKQAGRNRVAVLEP